MFSSTTKNQAPERYVKIPAPNRELKADVKTSAPSLLNRRTISMRRSKRGKPGGRSQRAPKVPPTIDTVVTAHSILRFTATSAAASTNVTNGTLIAAIGGICTVANSTITSVASSFKLHSITIWPGSTTAGAVQNAEVLWTELGGITRDESKSTAIPTGVTVSDVICERPPCVTQVAFWNDSTGSASTIFALTCPAGSIIDVSVTWTLRNNIPGFMQTGYAAATLGSFYYARLDGVGGKFLPLGVPTTN